FFYFFGSSLALQGPYVGQTLRLDQPDSVGGEIIAISDISFGTQEKTVPPRTARPISTLCWQIHRGLTVSVPFLRMWVHCPRASKGLLPRRSNLVGYVQ